ncbi:CLUMA_CG019986, isoform B [Clunio marinus]|uniref:CLUMA_CG019986, isoform B n=1 Tax=Clunio marinus TaxID=568069 RepID=A0A1J1J7V7_9DIPT|nr:CLUMA_CG019986, isoform B [Clunio marinus]
MDKRTMEKYQAISTTPVDEYKCQLSEELENMAKDELRETEETRKHGIEALREWALKNPRIIKTRLDTNWLLRHLRFRKFSVPMAMEAIERMMVVKDGPFGKGWFERIEVARPSVLRLLDTGFAFLLPERDYMGRRVIFYRPGVSNPMSPTCGFDVLTLMTSLFILLCEYEEDQIRGVVHVADASGIKMPHFTVFSPTYSFRIGKVTERILPLRHKGFHVVNVHKSLRLVHDVIMSQMSEKLKKRAHLYSNFDEFKAIETSKLPKEYGGTIPMKEMIDATKKLLLEKRDDHLLLSEMKVRQEFYPKQVLDGSVKTLKYLLNSPELYDKYQAKSITPVDKYKFTLSDELRKIAKEELRETDETREHALKALRDWAIKNPRIETLRLDSVFLLRFLRFKKFSIPMAQEALERYLVLRKYIYEGQFIYQNFDYKIPQLYALIDNGLAFALPQRDHLGRRVIFYRPRIFNPSKNLANDIIRLPGVVLETLLEDEENQIRGCVHVGDGSGLGLNYLTVLTPQQAYRIVKNCEKMVPMRHKEFHGTLCPPALKFVLEWGLSLMSPKLRSRVKLHSKLDDKDAIDRKLLPLEYGGTIPMREMIEMFKKELEAKRDVLLSHDEMNIRFELYPEAVRIGSAKALKVPLSAPDSAFETKKDYQAKSITPVDKYKFTLSDELRKIAKEELRETDETREHALKALRDWAIKNPRIETLRLDSVFLLRFLRFKKFSIPMAQEALERYLVLRKYIYEGQFIYQNFDYKIPQLYALIDNGLAFALPQRDHLGRRIIFYRPRAFNPSKNIPHDIIRLPGVVFETLLEDEENQIRGCVHVADGSGLGLNYLTVLTPQQAFRIIKNCERMVPMRHKEFHGLCPPSLKFVLEWALAMMSPKLRSRVRIHSKLDDANSVDTKLLPLEYGGTIPMREMIEMFKKELEAKRDVLLSHDEMNVRLELYPESVRQGSTRSLKIPLSAPDSAFDEKKDLIGMKGIQGSFRKLEID